MGIRQVFVAPEDQERYHKYHYASAVRAGELLLCSGVIGSRSGYVPSDPEAQFVLAFDLLGDVLHEAGCDYSDLLEITTFHVDYPNHLDSFLTVRDRYLEPPWPAWTAVGVASLSRPEILVELKATALVPT